MSLFSTKFINAIIRDAGNRFHVVHLKHFLGDYFVTTIDNQPYAFKMVGSEVLSYDEPALKGIRIINFSTKHYRPISDKTDAIKQLLEDNGLPRINMTLFQSLKTLGKREGKDFKKHDIEKLLEEIIKERDSEVGKILEKDGKYQQAAIRVIEFLKSLDTKEIITPVKEISEYIEDDLIATDAGFYGTVMVTHQRTDIEHKKVTNTTIGNKKPIVVVLAIIMLIGLIMAIGYIGYNEGWFDQFGDFFESFEGLGQGVSLQPPSQPVSQGSIAAKYKTPEDAKAAIERGDAKLTDFPPNMRDLLK